MKSPQRPKENETPTCNRLGRDDHLGHLLLDIGHCAGASTPRFARHPPDTGSSLPRPKHMVSFLPGGVGLDMLSGRGSKGEHPPVQHPSGIRRIWPFGLLKISLRLLPAVNWWDLPPSQPIRSTGGNTYTLWPNRPTRPTPPTPNLTVLVCFARIFRKIGAIPKDTTGEAFVQT